MKDQRNLYLEFPLYASPPVVPNLLGYISRYGMDTFRSPLVGGRGSGVSGEVREVKVKCLFLKILS